MAVKFFYFAILCVTEKPLRGICGFTQLEQDSPRDQAKTLGTQLKHQSRC